MVIQKGTFFSFYLSIHLPEGRVHIWLGNQRHKTKNSYLKKHDSQLFLFQGLPIAHQLQLQLLYL